MLQFNIGVDDGGSLTLEQIVDMQLGKYQNVFFCLFVFLKAWRCCAIIDRYLE